MRYLANDGKDYGTEEECLKHEREIEEKNNAELKIKRELEDTYARIQNDLKILNEEIDKYYKLGGTEIRWSINQTKHLVGERYGITEDVWKNFWKNY